MARPESAKRRERVCGSGGVAHVGAGYKKETGTRMINANGLRRVIIIYNVSRVRSETYAVRDFCKSLLLRLHQKDINGIRLKSV